MAGRGMVDVDDIVAHEPTTVLVQYEQEVLYTYLLAGRTSTYSSRSTVPYVCIRYRTVPCIPAHTVGEIFSNYSVFLNKLYLKYRCITYIYSINNRGYTIYRKPTWQNI